MLSFRKPWDNNREKEETKTYFGSSVLPIYIFETNNENMSYERQC